MSDIESLLEPAPTTGKTSDTRSGMSRPDLFAMFRELNDLWFGGLLAPPKLFWNSRLRSSAGRFIPGTRPGKWAIWKSEPPVIEIASYLLEENGAGELIRDTLGHEMIHYWLWIRGRPYGHTAEFRAKMKAIGVSRYNPVPRKRQYKYLYECGHCLKKYPARRRLGTLACGSCCRNHAGGRFDPRFRLVFVGDFVQGSQEKS